MTLTPRQIVAYLEFSNELDRKEWEAVENGRAGTVQGNG